MLNHNAKNNRIIKLLCVSKIELLCFVANRN